MMVLKQSGRGLIWGAVLVLGAATLAFAQFGGGGARADKEPPPVLEYTQQEVQPALLVQTLNELGRQHWDVFQIVPGWGFNNQNGEAELVAKNYQVFARRPVALK